MDGPPVCSRPGIFLKDSLPTKSCSKPTICTKQPLFNHDVSSLGAQAPAVWVGGGPLSVTSERHGQPCAVASLSPASAFGSWQRFPDELAHQASLLRGWLLKEGPGLAAASRHCLSLADPMRTQSTPPASPRGAFPSHCHQPQSNPSCIIYLSIIYLFIHLFLIQ